MIIDFKEIPPANKGKGVQDIFEQFTCDFLETMGYKIIRRPDRGPDGKKDLIVSETRIGVGGETTVNWLVSCKHTSHSGVAVKDTDEEDIHDRVIKHDCQGFMGFYSTIPASTLSDKLHSFRDKIEYKTYDATRIEKELLMNNQKERLLSSYFPISYERYQKKSYEERFSITEKERSPAVFLTEEDVLRITKTAIIILEIEKIKEKFNNEISIHKINQLNKLYRFSSHTNEKVADAVFTFLESVSSLSMVMMPNRIASSIHSLIFTYFPSSNENENLDRLENGKKCANIGFNLAYDAFIHSNNFKIAEFGLSILKYVYQKGKQLKMPDLSEFALKLHNEVEQHLDRPERKDLENAKEFIKVFKDALDTKDLRFPDLPDHLFTLTLRDDFEE